MHQGRAFLVRSSAQNQQFFFETVKSNLRRIKRWFCEARFSNAADGVRQKRKNGSRSCSSKNPFKNAKHTARLEAAESALHG